MPRAVPGRSLRARDTRVYPSALGEYGVECWRVESTFVNTGTADPQYGEEIREGELLIPQTLGAYADLDAADRDPQELGGLPYVVRDRDDEMRARWEARAARQVARAGASAVLESDGEMERLGQAPGFTETTPQISVALLTDEFASRSLVRRGHGLCYDVTYRSLTGDIPFLLGCADGLIEYRTPRSIENDGLAQEIDADEVDEAGTARLEDLTARFLEGDGVAVLYIRSVRVAIDRRLFLQARGL